MANWISNHLWIEGERAALDEFYYRHLKETTNLENSFVEYNKSSSPPEKELEMTHCVTYNDLHINTDNNTNKRYTNTPPSQSPNRSPKNPEAPDGPDDASSKYFLVTNEFV